MLLNINLKIINEQIGGGSEEVKEMISKMSTNRHTIVSDNKIFRFYFNDMNHVITMNSNYLGAGSYTGVFGISEEPTNPIKIQHGTGIILRVLIQETKIDEYIAKYKADIEKFPHNIPLHYMYGTLTFVHSGITYTKMYVIVKKYYNSKDILQFDLVPKVKILKSCLQTIKQITEKGICYRDLKTSNIGCDENYIFIILDYDMKTLFTVDTSNVKKIEKLLNDYVSSTFLPFYFINQVISYSVHRNIKMIQFDKIYLLGLTQVMFDLLYGINNTFGLISINRAPNYHILHAKYLKNFSILMAQIPKNALYELFANMINPLQYEELFSIDMIIEQFNRVYPDEHLPGKIKYIKMKEKYMKLKNNLIL